MRKIAKASSQFKEGIRKQYRARRKAKLKRAQRELSFLEKKKVRKLSEHSAGTRIEMPSSRDTRTSLAGVIGTGTRAQRRRWNRDVRLYSVWHDGSWRHQPVPEHIVETYKRRVETLSPPAGASAEEPVSGTWVSQPKTEKTETASEKFSGKLKRLLGYFAAPGGRRLNRGNR